MAKRHPQEKRSKARTGLRMTMPILLVSISDGGSIECSLADIAAAGIGVIVRKKLEVGHEVRFKTLGNIWNMSVSWCEPTDGGYKCGLVLTDPAQDMTPLFTSFRDYKNAI